MNTTVNGQQSKMAEYLSKDLTNQQILQRDPVTNKATVVFKAGNKVSYKIGGPYTISGKKDIYVGDIWVMAGQSNMRGHGFLKNAFRQDEPEKVLNHVHLFDSTEKWRVNSDPSHQLYLSNRTVHRTLPDPTVKNPEIAKFRGASIGPSFGANYESGIPLGLIASSHGGVSLKDWARPKELNADSYDKTLYGAMIDRIRKTGGHIAGILWYQGESDALRAEDADTYGDRFRDWLKLLRADTRTNLPVVFVQLGPHRNDAPDTIKYWMTVQDQQRKLIGENDYTACVTAIDCSLDDKVHISKDGLNILGKRLATAAILTKKGDAKNVTPTPKSATYQKLIHIKGLVEVHTILLQFNLPDGFKFNSGSADVIGFDVQNQNNVAILRTRVEEDAKSIRIYLTGSPSTGSSQAYVNYGMNQTSINLNYGEDRVLPAFKNLLVATQ